MSPLSTTRRSSGNEGGSVKTRWLFAAGKDGGKTRLFAGGKGGGKTRLLAGGKGGVKTCSPGNGMRCLWAIISATFLRVVEKLEARRTATE